MAIRNATHSGSELHIQVKCQLCPTTAWPLVGKDEWERYTKGALVQDVWSDWSPARREIIIGQRSGMYLCDDCFPKEDEDGNTI